MFIFQESVAIANRAPGTKPEESRSWADAMRAKGIAPGVFVLANVFDDNQVLTPIGKGTLGKITSIGQVDQIDWEKKTISLKMAGAQGAMIKMDFTVPEVQDSGDIERLNGRKVRIEFKREAPVEGEVNGGKLPTAFAGGKLELVTGGKPEEVPVRKITGMKFLD
jgi:hypothetical protein